MANLQYRCLSRSPLMISLYYRNMSQATCLIPKLLARQLMPFGDKHSSLMAVASLTKEEDLITLKTRLTLFVNWNQISLLFLDDFSSAGSY
jgi:hypothetical protein